ncbi:MAG TPA: hypothetical protein VH137_08135 [Gemmatimonadales bacterium]|jgi:hypothetical protein|nr:hypothetical protein [Gemmatimonadales bacterium]
MRTGAALTTLFLILSSAAGCRTRQSPQAAMDMGAMGALDSTDERTDQAAHEAMSETMTMDPHMTLTPLRRPSAADSGRAAELVQLIRRALDRYRNVRAAEADGFRQFLPGVKQPTYHFTKRRWALAEMFRFDPAKPTSLLYRPGADGGFVLTGVMYTAPARTSLDELDRRIPLSVARWHEHVNWCLPPVGQAARWRETRDGKPVFGPKSPIATGEACAAVGGRFVPRIFGWMVHVMAFASEDPKVIWGGGLDHMHS